MHSIALGVIVRTASSATTVSEKNGRGRMRGRKSVASAAIFMCGHALMRNIRRRSIGLLKGWGYTPDQGAWTNSGFFNHIREAFTVGRDHGALLLAIGSRGAGSIKPHAPAASARTVMFR